MLVIIMLLFSLMQKYFYLHEGRKVIYALKTIYMECKNMNGEMSEGKKKSLTCRGLTEGRKGGRKGWMDVRHEAE